MMKRRLMLISLGFTAAQAQTLVVTPGEGPATLLPSDAVVLESRESKADLPCTVRPTAPEIGFDFAFHGGYEASVSMRELAGDGNLLASIFRVTPEDPAEDAVYFSQKWKVPAIDSNARGSADLRGGIILGEGTYRVDWLLRDRLERFCSAHWQVTAMRRGKDRLVQMRLPPGTVLPEAKDPYFAEEPVRRDRYGLNVLVLVHLAAQSGGAAAMRPAESAALISILRNVAREPRIGSYSVVAFNLDHNQILYRQTSTPAVDFPALGEAVKKLSLGTIEVRQLLEKDTEVNFFSRVLQDELTQNMPKAVILIGPKITGEAVTLDRVAKILSVPSCPVFYLNYNANPAANPWRDLMGSAVRFWRGSEYTIARPRDLALAWSDVMARLPVHTGSALGAESAISGDSLISKK